MRVLALLTVALLCAAGAQAEAVLEQAGIARLAAFSESAGGFDVAATARRLLAGDLVPDADGFNRIAARFIAVLKDECFGLLSRLMAPALAGLALRILLGERQAATRGAMLSCRVACASVLFGAFAEARAVAAAAMRLCVDIVNATLPVLVTALSLTGMGAAAGMLSPLAALCAGIMENLIAARGLPMCALAAVVAASGNLSERFRLNQLFALLKRTLVGATGLLTTGFVGLLALEGLIVAGQDTAAVRTARRAVRSALPVIGGAVSGALESVADGAAAVRNAVGGTGALLLLAACLAPMLKLGAGMLSVRLAGAILEPAADRCMSDMASQFAGAMEMLLALCAGCLLLGVLLIGAGLAAAGSLAR